MSDGLTTDPLDQAAEGTVKYLTAFPYLGTPHSGFDIPALAERGEETQSGKDDLIAVLYIAAVGLLISFAALLDDMLDLTSWFGLPPPDLYGLL